MISIIIPVVNEAAYLPATFGALQGQGEAHEIIVVDARSSDGSPEIAADSGARVIPACRRQRAAQMNLGAGAASGDVLLFLHADTRLAAGALKAIREAFQQPAVDGGGFARRYDTGSLFLRLTCALAEVRTRCLGWFLGDQAIFVRREVFAELGGFRKWHIFEDLDFSRRMARAGRVVTLRPPVMSAGRRFTRRGPVQTTWSDFWLTARYLAGAKQRRARPVRELPAEDHAPNVPTVVSSVSR